MGKQTFFRQVRLHQQVEVTWEFLVVQLLSALWGMSLVIPGLTSSLVMMALGLYQPMLEGLARLP